MKDHPNTIANRLAHIDALADQLAAALAPHGFTYYPRIEDADHESDFIASIQHRGTQTTLIVGLGGVLLTYFVGPTTGTAKRTEYQSIRLGHATRGLPITEMDLKPIVFLARTVVSELTIEDDVKAAAQHGAVA